MNLFLASPTITLLLAVGTVLIVGFLYWLKPPPPTVMVSSSLLWKKLLKQRKKSSFIDKIRWLLSLLLASIIAISLVVASGGPELFSDEVTDIENVSIVIDNSGTMATLTQSGESRWQNALGYAESLIIDSHPSNEVVLLDTGGQITSRLSTNKWEALTKLESLALSFGDAHHFPNLPEREDRTVFISDGVSNVMIPSDVEVVSVFELAENVGITGLAVMPNTDGDPSTLRGLVQITNGSPIPKEVRLRASGLGGANISLSLTVGPGASEIRNLDLTSFQQGPIRTSVTSVRDGLVDDNVAYAVIPSRTRTRVTMVTPGNVYLETAFKAMSQIELVTVSKEEYDSDDVTDLYVFDRFIPEVVPDTPGLFFLPTELPMLESSSSGGSLEMHPLFKGVSLSDLMVERVASPNFLTDDSQILWGDTETPLLVASDLNYRMIEVGFALDGSNFPLQPAFPIFLRNAVVWMLESDLPQSSGPGQIEIPGMNTTVTDLEGKSVQTNSIDQVTSFEARAPNLYSVNQGENTFWMPINLTNPRVTLVNESKLESASPLDTNGLVDTELESQADPALWRMLALIAFVLVTLEWVTYHRRITV
ncbi:MAG: BatA domain-containing protein [Gemmatimonadetes bacterium]|nr:BatA domain-containing protein [Gemmatimonadota bacterium]